jgi:octaprenyl-diphosphate synthase
VKVAQHRQLSGLDTIIEPVHREFEELNRYFTSYLNTDVPLINSIFEHLLDGGGKRIRPLLILLIASSSPERNSEDRFRLAVAVEFLHTATLLHDDVVDHSDIRRGNRVAYRVWGVEPSVLSGDYLYSRAFNLLVDIGHLGILEVISTATTEMARGEILQLLRSYSTATTLEEYLEVINAKTASIISASCKAAAYLAGFEGQHLAAFWEYGQNLGLCFQIVDDVLDYTAERGAFGKAIGKDFLEGKVTLPLIVLMDLLGKGERRLVSEIFLKESPENEDFKMIMGLMKDHQALEKTMEVAQQFSDAALRALASVPEDSSRESLESLARYVLERTS